MQTENSKLATATQWAGVLLLVALAVAINGGANFYGGFILATELGMSSAAGYAVGSALAIVTLFLLGAYLTGKRGLPVVYLHVFSGCLLMFDVMHLAQMSVNAVSSANGNIAQIESEISDIDYQIATAEKELSGLAVTATGNNVQSLTAQINKLKNTVVQGGTVWAVSNGCTVGGYRTKCSQITTLQGELDAEIAAVSGAEVTKKRGEITKLMGVRAEKEGVKVGAIKKSDSAGFIAKMKPETWSVNGFLLAISMPFAVSFELFSVLAFGMLKSKMTPENPLLSGRGEAGLRPKPWAWIHALVTTRLEVDREAKLIEAESRGKAEGEARVKAAQDIAEKTQKMRFASDNLEEYMKNITDAALAKIMDKKSIASAGGVDAEKRLHGCVKSAIALYDEGGTLPVSGKAALFLMIGDKEKHCRTRTIPALIQMGFAYKDDAGKVRWRKKRECWEAIGLIDAPISVERSGLKPKLFAVK